MPDSPLASKFIPAKHFQPASGREIKWIVIHSMEAPEKGDTAESVARYFQTTTRPASAHYNVDNNSIVQCVQDKDVAYGAPGANRHGLHIEHAGYARQFRADWLDSYSAVMLRLSAKLVAEKCRQYSVPAVWLTTADLEAGRKGITSHAACSRAFGGTHTDPGAGFPSDLYIQLVRDAMAEAATVRVLIEEGNTRAAVPGANARIEAGTTVVALRPLVEALGFSATFDKATGEVVIRKG